MNSKIILLLMILFVMAVANAQLPTMYITECSAVTTKQLCGSYCACSWNLTANKCVDYEFCTDTIKCYYDQEKCETERQYLSIIIGCFIGIPIMLAICICSIWIMWVIFYILGFCTQRVYFPFIDTLKTKIDYWRAEKINSTVNIMYTEL
jgi:hypothetical protein